MEQQNIFLHSITTIKTRFFANIQHPIMTGDYRPNKEELDEEEENEGEVNWQEGNIEEEDWEDKYAEGNQEEDFSETFSDWILHQTGKDLSYLFIAVTKIPDGRHSLTVNKSHFEEANEFLKNIEHEMREAFKNKDIIRHALSKEYWSYKDDQRESQYVRELNAEYAYEKTEIMGGGYMAPPRQRKKNVRLSYEEAVSGKKTRTRSPTPTDDNMEQRLSQVHLAATKYSTDTLALVKKQIEEMEIKINNKQEEQEETMNRKLVEIREETKNMIEVAERNQTAVIETSFKTFEERNDSQFERLAGMLASLQKYPAEPITQYPQQQQVIGTVQRITPMKRNSCTTEKEQDRERGTNKEDSYTMMVLDGEEDLEALEEV